MIKRALVVAAAWPLAAMAQSPAANVALGERIATQGGGDQVTACASCHGARGDGNAQANFPRLAAQGALYLENQLESYANGARTNPVMTPIAKAMSAQQRAAASAYYAQIAAPRTAGVVQKVDKSTISRGRTLSAVGDARRGVQACANCHGVDGAGKPPALPYLAGQDADYARATLGDWRSGARRSDPSGMMPVIAKQLSDADVDAVATYFASLAPPAPTNASARIVPDTRSASAPAAVQAPQAGAPPVGTGQGAATTGGTQGAGGQEPPGAGPAAGGAASPASGGSTQGGSATTGGSQGAGGTPPDGTKRP